MVTDIKQKQILTNLEFRDMGYNKISLSRHEQVCLSGLRFERYFSHHRAKYLVINNSF